MATLTALRYSGSAHLGASSTPSTPSAAALRKIAPTLVWSTMSSSTTTVRALGEHLVHRRQRTPFERRQRAAVHVEAGDLLGERLGDDEAGRGRASEHVGEPVQPPRRHQERADREAGLHRPAHDLLPLGEEQPVLGLVVLAQLARRAGRGSRRAGGPAGPRPRRAEPPAHATPPRAGPLGAHLPARLGRSRPTAGRACRDPGRSSLSRPRMMGARSQISSPDTRPCRSSTRSKTLLNVGGRR